MRKIEKALDTLLELDEVLLQNFDVRDPDLWIRIAFKYLKETVSELDKIAQDAYNESKGKL